GVCRRAARWQGGIRPRPRPLPGAAAGLGRQGDGPVRPGRGRRVRGRFDRPGDDWRRAAGSTQRPGVVRTLRGIGGSGMKCPICGFAELKPRCPQCNETLTSWINYRAYAKQAYGAGLAAVASGATGEAAELLLRAVILEPDRAEYL